MFDCTGAGADPETLGGGVTEFLTVLGSRSFKGGRASPQGFNFL